VRDRRNFMDCVRMLKPGARVTGQGRLSRCFTAEREVLVGTFPISIDFKQFAKTAASREVEDQAWIVHANLPERQLLLGVDRLDYTKGIPLRLKAFANALALPGAAPQRLARPGGGPSREEVPEYEALKREIERLVGEINGRFTEVGWTPIHYIYRSLSRVELLAYYRTCEVALITPLKDGMNLVAKEFCACSIENNGVLILSEFAGPRPSCRTAPCSSTRTTSRAWPTPSTGPAPWRRTSGTAAWRSCAAPFRSTTSSAG
jgi:trehalose 6-phosphate synthase (EC 2.4.1.15)